MLLTFILKSISFYQFKKSLHSENVEHLELVTKPTPLNSILWNAQVETKNGYRSAYYSFFDKNAIVFDSEIPKNHELLTPYIEQDDIRTIIALSRGFYFIEEVTDGFIYTDMRFGQFGFTEKAPYGCRYKLTKNLAGELTIKKLDFPAGSANFSDALSSLFIRIKGN
jgi:inner membrane protein